MHKASYTLKGKTISLEKLYNENKDQMQLQFNPESVNKRLLVRTDGIAFWLSHSGKITVSVKTQKKDEIKAILTNFYKKVVVKYLFDNNSI